MFASEKVTIHFLKQIDDGEAAEWFNLEVEKNIKLTDATKLSLFNEKIAQIDKGNYDFDGYYLKEDTGISKKSLVNPSISSDITVVAKYITLSSTFPPFPPFKNLAETRNIEIFYGEEIFEAKAYITNYSEIESKVKSATFRDVEYTPNNKKLGQIEAIIDILYNDTADIFSETVKFQFTVKPLKDKYSLVAKEGISQTVGSPALPPTDFVKNSNEGENLPESTEFAFQSDFDWNKEGEQTNKVLVTFEDKSTALIDVTLTLNAKPTPTPVPYYPYIPDVVPSVPNTDIKEGSEKIEEPNAETNNLDPISPAKEANKIETAVETTVSKKAEEDITKTEDTTEINIAEEDTARGEANLDTSEEDTGNADTTSIKSKKKASGLTGSKINSTLSGAANTNSSKKLGLAKTGGKENHFSLSLSLFSFLSILGIASFLFKKVK